MADPILELKDLTIHFETNDGVFQAVNHIDLSLERGTALGLVGETGAGKTTTALGIMNLVRTPPGKIVSGEVIFNGEDLLKKNKSAMRKIRGEKISMIFQDPMTALNPIETVGDQIGEVIRLHQKCSRLEAAKKAGELLEMVGIPADRASDYPHQFSGGMKQRVVISIALACKPDLIIADEPTTALDVTIQAQILQLLHDLRNELNMSMILISHDLGVISECCDFVAVMYAGSIMEYGKIDRIYENMAHPYTIRLFNALPNIEEDSERLTPIPGLMPDPSNLPSGCPFWTRCANHLPECEKTMPTFKEIEKDHFVRCHLHNMGLLEGNNSSEGRTSDE